MAADVRMLAEGQEEIVTVHLLSYDEDDVVNRLALSSGFKSRDNIFLGARMEGVYGYEDGMPLKLLWNGKSTSFSMKGTCNGPDYIYAIPPGGAMIPDGTVYDIACIQKDRMEELTGKYDIVNELGFLLEADYTYEDIRSVLSERLAPYGLISMSKKEDQTSLRYGGGGNRGADLHGNHSAVMFLFYFCVYAVCGVKKDDRSGPESDLAP